jgi:hypothetical protein
MKRLVNTLAAAAALTMANSVFACGGNACPSPTAPSFDITVDGFVTAAGGAIGVAAGEYHANGDILDVVKASEAANLTDFEGELILNTCDAEGPCPSSAKLDGKGEAFSRDVTFVSTTGPSSATESQGATALDLVGAVNVTRYEQ